MLSCALALADTSGLPVLDVQYTDYDGNELLLGDILGTENDYVYKSIEESEEKKMIKRALSTLNDRDRHIIELSYGINRNGNELTQKEVADLLGISQSYISRLEKRIINKLKKQIEITFITPTRYDV